MGSGGNEILEKSNPTKESENSQLASPRSTPYLSVIIPIYNEESNLPILFDALWPHLNALNLSYEVIAVNDGSRDRSLALLKEEARKRNELRVVDFRRNFGQTAAMMAGIDHARGDIIVSLDADLQNDPADIPMLLAKLDEGFDVVSGWRKDRQDAKLTRTLPSRIANWFISRVSGVSLHDYGCTLKAYRSEMLKGVRLYGEMHRFIPIYARWQGAKVTEMVVRHHPRRHGKSNYGLERTIKVLLDVMVVKFLHSYFGKPIYVFGIFGFVSFLIALLSGLAAIYLKIFEGVSFISTPLPMLTVLTILIGFISVLMGLLAEMLVRIYFESQQRTAYDVRELVNFPSG